MSDKGGSQGGGGFFRSMRKRLSVDGVAQPSSSERVPGSANYVSNQHNDVYANALLRFGAALGGQNYQKPSPEDIAKNYGVLGNLVYTLRTGSQTSMNSPSSAYRLNFDGSNALTKTRASCPKGMSVSYSAPSAYSGKASKGK